MKQLRPGGSPRAEYSRGRLGFRARLLLLALAPPRPMEADPAFEQGPPGPPEPSEECCFREHRLRLPQCARVHGLEAGPPD